MKIPNEIEINVDTFNGKTTDGQNETEVINQFNSLIDKEKASALANVTLSGFENFCLWGGAIIGIIGLIMMLSSSAFLGLIAIIAGIGMLINHFSKKNKVDQNRQIIENKFEEKRKQGSQIIKATLAEIVDFRSEFAEKDRESQKVIDFLEQISPEQYVKKLSDSGRRIKI
jgi:Na+-transporting methylmalonyl-CoA/oxaloacetate decarboxylase gamma subunit